MTEPKDPAVRVVDRRWWARGEAGGASSEDGSARKPTYVEELERQVADAAAQLAALRADHKRALEEFDQAKSRLRRDVAREVDRGVRAVLVELVEVLDNLDRAVGSPGTAAADAALLRGVELVRDQFLAKLEGFGVARIAAAGQPFDALRHEAVSLAPVQDAAEDGIVVAVIREGYAIGDDLIRPASVVVGKRAD